MTSRSGTWKAWRPVLAAASLLAGLSWGCGTSPGLGNNDDGQDAGVLPSCGDGVVDPGEQCDDGAGNSDVAADACRSDCRSPRCGDGVVDSGEQCEAGVVPETCEGLGYAGGRLACAAATCTLDASGCSGWAALARSEDTTCAVRPDGALFCWGSNQHGLLGAEAGLRSPEPAWVADTGDATRLAVGPELGCAIHQGGQLSCWGTLLGQPVDPSTPQEGIPPVVGVSVGAWHACVVAEDGSVWCWGGNQDGQLGDGTQVDRASPVSVSLPDAAAQVAAGKWHSCAVLKDGRVFCWGQGGSGQLGPASVGQSSTPVAVTGLGGPATAVAAGSEHSCALMTTGAVRCWGNNVTGQLGDGSGVSSASPVTVSGLTGQTQIVAFTQTSCSLSPDGHASCWGHGGQGQLGSGTRAPSFSPAPVLTSEPIARLADGGPCGLLESSLAVCWGSGSNGPLGPGIPMSPVVPAPVVGVYDVRDLSSGGGVSCAIGGPLRTLSCWGINDYGQLGDGTTHLSGLAREVPYLSGVQQIGVGVHHVCAAYGDLRLRCWGENGHGQLGDGSLVDSLAPVEVTGLGVVSQVSAGGDHTCAVTPAGALYCWGSNQHAKLGVGGTSDAPSPQAVSLSDVVAVSAGLHSTCAIRRPSGQPAVLTCWGHALFDAVSGPGAQPPQEVGEVVNPRSVSLKMNGCAVDELGQVWCWGVNDFGEMGDGTNDDQDTPIQVQGLIGVDVEEVAAGGHHACARDTGGDVYCWGDNSRGQLGIGSLDAQPFPVKLEITDVVAMRMGWAFSCFERADGTLRCAGDNITGSAGIGAVSSSALPVAAPDRP